MGAQLPDVIETPSGKRNFHPRFRLMPDRTFLKVREILFVIKLEGSADHLGHDVRKHCLKSQGVSCDKAF
ncbi:hypothetical protein D3C84_1269780 [compost metagenome]